MHCRAFLDGKNERRSVSLMHLVVRIHLYY